MLIREIMNSDLITINPEASLNKAYKVMMQNKIRHLPVLENGKLIGIITDRDLRLATSKLAEHPFDPQVPVKDVMTTSVFTVHPSDPIGMAIRIMRESKIGSLPVVENNKLVGILTGIDVLDAMLILTGMDKPSGRLDVRVSDKSGELARLSKILADKGVNILSVLSYTEPNGNVRVILRVNTMEIRKLASAICDSDFEVLWPPHISCVE
jgi:acetoin utilization protein AcuB